MDAVNFVKILRRMKNEDTWEIYESLLLNGTDSPEDAINSIEAWAKEHPAKTRQSEFLKQWPNAKIDCKGVIVVDPCDVDETLRGKYGGCYYTDCDKCRREFWLQEVK